MGQDVAISLPAVTKLVGDNRRTGNNRKKPHRMVAMDGDGGVTGGDDIFASL
jgi:hypothetical protein